MTLVIGFTGPAEHGKSACAAAAENWLQSRGFNVKILSFADRLKQACKVIFRLTDKDLNNSISKATVRPHLSTTPREILQKFGTEICRDKIKFMLPQITDYSIWTWNMEQDIAETEADTVIIIPDVRFADEMEMLQKYNSFIIRVKRPHHTNHVGTEHVSEQGTFNVDYEILNKGTLSDLEDTVSEIMDIILS